MTDKRVPRVAASIDDLRAGQWIASKHDADDWWRNTMRLAHSPDQTMFTPWDEWTVVILSDPPPALPELIERVRELEAALRKHNICPTCQGLSRETVGMVCQTCGWDYMNGEKR